MTGIGTVGAGAGSVVGTRNSDRLREFVGKYGLLIVYAAVFLFFASKRTDSFLRIDTWTRTILSPTGFTPLLVLALGLTVVLAMGDFDLSFGNMVGLAGGTAAALMINYDINWVVAIFIALLIGVTVGLANGYFVAYLNASSFVITLAAGTILFGIETLWTNNRSISGLEVQSFLDLDETKVIQNMRLPFFIAIAFFLLVWLMLDRTELGRFMYAIGGNREAARLAGIRVQRIRTIGFIVVALSATIVGILLVANIGGTRSDLGTAFLLDAYAAVFLGAAVFRPGQFNAPGTLVGVVFLRTVEVGLLQMQIANSWINISKGVILLFGVLLSQLVVRRR